MSIEPDKSRPPYIIESEDTPAILYHYTDWNGAFHQNRIKSPEIYMARADSFNDPYDCGVLPRYDIWSKDEHFYQISRLLKSENPDYDDNLIKDAFKDRMHEFKDDYRQFGQNREKMPYKVLSDAVGIFCLSEIQYNMLMWSHYSDKHGGICIGYNTKLLRDIVLHYLDTLSPSSKIVHYLKAKYCDSYPNIRPSTDTTDPKNFTEPLRIKYADWRYEREWRLVAGIIRSNKTFSEEERAVKIPIEAIVEVYFGLNCRNNKDQIIMELSNKGYKGRIFQMIKIDYSFQFGYEELKI